MSILLIEDNLSLSTLVSMYLTSENIDNDTAPNGYEGLKLLSEKEYDVLITDIRMPGMSGNEVMEKAAKLYPDMPVIIITAHGNIPDAVAAIRKGAYDYLTKPFENEELLNSIKKAVEISRMRRENTRMKQYMKQSIAPKMVGKSEAFIQMLNLADTVAPTDAPVLVLGESGTGKELIARQVHSKSNRADKPFITVNCAAVPEGLFESELFGHKKGSFTSADRDYKGKILEAEGGTLFLDEIGELPQSIQVKLLRFLQESEIQPVGSATPMKVDVRVVAATNRSLKQMTEKGEFRDDLFYRLNVFPVEVPPLSKRREDIKDLVELFSAKYGARITFSEKAMEKLINYSWTGNIRELENTIYRLCILQGKGEITEDKLPAEFCSNMETCLDMHMPDKELNLEELEKNIIIKALHKFDGNKSRAAKYLCIPRHVLLYRLEKYEIN
ncbi:two component, sigma54 specific, transcriptional regulator, Fis family [Denitrovibrio acetiphilus DSM 12809]|uniref:Two component, sigma54 specific, transcriptional regulator, Fis family n=1 Tax=Denitrovibrio acetiphilus (strain DSM 12809 / NBRC 114555 / N2460) TaxID=522772 RepID=D4H1H2_DENA2|nr:sigma-54 dependent transcriptional regulator [Denitrovibrio acetiphilus]ADD68732.1 two component, sigma54 specific, transcriptional regulator, Fis family [Denitrovibrio acetiphilus DSM 12809]